MYHNNFIDLLKILEKIKIVLILLGSVCPCLNLRIS